MSMPYEEKENHVELKVGFMTYRLRTPMTDACAKEVERLANQFIMEVAASNKRLGQTLSNFQDAYILALLNACYAFYQTQMQCLDMSNEISKSSQDVTQWQRQVELAQKEALVAQNQMSDQIQELSDLRTQFEQYKAANYLLSKDVQFYKQESDHLKSLLTQKKEEHKQLEIEMANVIQENEALRKEIEDAKKQQKNLRGKKSQSKTNSLSTLPPLRNDRTDFSQAAQSNPTPLGLTSLIVDHDKINKDQSAQQDPVKGSIPSALGHRRLMSSFITGDESEAEEANSLFIAPDDNKASGAENI